MLRKLNRSSVVVVVVAGALAATAGATVSVGEHMTLVKADLPAGFSQTFSHRLPQDELIKMQGTVTAGYGGGWQRAFARLQGVDTSVITSTAVTYDTSDHAHTAVRATWKRTLAHTGAKRLTVGRPLGHEARAIAYQTATGITAYAVVWRYENVNGSVVVVGLKSLGVTLDLATRLAVRQQRHVRAAAG